LKKRILSILFAVTLILSFGLMTGPVSASPGAPTIDGVIDIGEWGTPLCTETGVFQTVTVYAYATTDALYLAFDTGDTTDERGEAGLGVLDWNIGLVGSDMTVPWRYALRTKISPDESWGVAWSAIDNGYYGCWEDTWNPNPAPLDKYWEIPAGLEMVTSFNTGLRVTEFKVPMSIMFDGTHGWDGLSAGDVLLLGGTFQGEDDLGHSEMLWWPTGINHSDAGTYAEVTVPAGAATVTTDVVEDIIQITIDPTSFNFGQLRQGQCAVPQPLTITSGSNMDIVVGASTISPFYSAALSIGTADDWELVNDWADDVVQGGTLNTNLKVCVPVSWDAGIETGTIIFWAEATP